MKEFPEITSKLLAAKNKKGDHVKMIMKGKFLPYKKW